MKSLSNSSQAVRRWLLALSGVAATAAVLSNPVSAAELVVRVAGVTAPMGQIGYSLFASSAGFPMDNSGARAVWLPADPQGVTCRFNDVSAGSYAVSVGHDLNGNQRVDTNFIGLPTEQWGVSNNARPWLRAPRFDEAVFTVEAGAPELTIAIRVAK